MKLTRQQRRQLEWFRDHRDRDPSFVVEVVGEWRIFVGYAILFLLSFTSSIVLGTLVIPVVVFFLICGGVAVNVGQAGARCRMWPAIKKILDWAELERTLGDAYPSASHDGTNLSCGQEQKY